jgi:hypothetical protein
MTQQNSRPDALTGLLNGIRMSSRRFAEYTTLKIPERTQASLVVHEHSDSDGLFPDSKTQRVAFRGIEQCIGVSYASSFHRVVVRPCYLR